MNTATSVSPAFLRDTKVSLNNAGNRSWLLFGNRLVASEIGWFGFVVVRNCGSSCFLLGKSGRAIWKNNLWRIASALVYKKVASGCQKCELNLQVRE